jgi:hypothetical protein
MALIAQGYTIRSKDLLHAFVGQLGADFGKLKTTNGLEDVYHGVMTIAGVKTSAAGRSFHDAFTAGYDHHFAAEHGREKVMALDIESRGGGEVSVGEFSAALSSPDLSSTSYAALFDTGHYDMGSTGNYYREMTGIGVGLIAAGGAMVATDGAAAPIAPVLYEAGKDAGTAGYDLLFGGPIAAVESGEIKRQAEATLGDAVAKGDKARITVEQPDGTKITVEAENYKKSDGGEDGAAEKRKQATDTAEAESRRKREAELKEQQDLKKKPDGGEGMMVDDGGPIDPYAMVVDGDYGAPINPLTSYAPGFLTVGVPVAFLQAVPGVTTLEEMWSYGATAFSHVEAMAASGSPVSSDVAKKELLRIMGRGS